MSSKAVVYTACHVLDTRWFFNGLLELWFENIIGFFQSRQTSGLDTVCQSFQFCYSIEDHALYYYLNRIVFLGLKLDFGFISFY